MQARVQRKLPLLGQANTTRYLISDAYVGTGLEISTTGKQCNGLTALPVDAALAVNAKVTIKVEALHSPWPWSGVQLWPGSLRYFLATSCAGRSRGALLCNLTLSASFPITILNAEQRCWHCCLKQVCKDFERWLAGLTVLVTERFHVEAVSFQDLLVGIPRQCF